MTESRHDVLGSMLRAELRWLMQLRWAVAATVVLLGVLHAAFGSAFGHKFEIIAVGLAIFLWNLCLWLGSPKRAKTGTVPLLLVAWAHLIVDLVCLTLLTVWTGGVLSPLLGLYVIHMVFASVLLSRVQAFVAAAAAAGMLCVGLLLTDQWPSGEREDLILTGWVVSLPLAVYVVNRITRELFRLEQKRLRAQNKLRKMRRRLASQQQRMMQHEKLVSMGQLAAGVAHEISNPLAGMDGLLQLMERHPEKPRPEAVATLREQVARIQQTVRQLTGLAHPDLGQPGRVEVNSLVTDALEMLKYDHRLRKVKVELDLAKDAGSVELVARAMHQVLINLVFNALDAMDDVDEPVLRVRTRRDTDSVFIDVEDTGCGISPAAWDHVFRPFYTSKPIGKGTGLGLPISLALVRGQGGELTFRSEVGKCTVFTVRLPVRPEQSGGAVDTES